MKHLYKNSYKDASLKSELKTLEPYHPSYHGEDCNQLTYVFDTSFDGLNNFGLSTEGIICDSTSQIFLKGIP